MASFGNFDVSSDSECVLHIAGAIFLDDRMASFRKKRLNGHQFSALSAWFGGTRSLPGFQTINFPKRGRPGRAEACTLRQRWPPGHAVGAQPVRNSRLPRIKRAKRTPEQEVGSDQAINKDAHSRYIRRAESDVGCSRLADRVSTRRVLPRPPRGLGGSDRRWF